MGADPRRRAAPLRGAHALGVGAAGSWSTVRSTSPSSRHDPARLRHRTSTVSPRQSLKHSDRPRRPRVAHEDAYDESTRRAAHPPSPAGAQRTSFSRVLSYRPPKDPGVAEARRSTGRATGTRPGRAHDEHRIEDREDTRPWMIASCPNAGRASHELHPGTGLWPALQPKELCRVISVYAGRRASACPCTPRCAGGGRQRTDPGAERPRGHALRVVVQPREHVRVGPAGRHRAACRRQLRHVPWRCQGRARCDDPACSGVTRAQVTCR